MEPDTAGPSQGDRLRVTSVGLFQRHDVQCLENNTGKWCPGGPHNLKIALRGFGSFPSVSPGGKIGSGGLRRAGGDVDGSLAGPPPAASVPAAPADVPTLRSQRSSWWLSKLVAVVTPLRRLCRFPAARGAQPAVGPRLDPSRRTRCPPRRPDFPQSHSGFQRNEK